MDIASMKMEKDKNNPSSMLGKGCMMPFQPSCSGARKIMFDSNLAQRLALCDPDVPFISTGFERQFGLYSSSHETMDGNFKVVTTIPKFSDKPMLHYYVIGLLEKDGEQSIHVIERVEYNHITESYGYLYNNDILDGIAKRSMNRDENKEHPIIDTIYDGDLIKKSTSFDEYDNRMDGKNILVEYTASEYTLEDPVVVSKSCSEKLASPLIHKLIVSINDNDILLNIYGDGDEYKVLPDIGEDIKNGILCVIRKEKKEESLYSQSYSRLSEPTISDQKFILNGTVVDVNVYCNAPDKLVKNPYEIQINKYYQDHIRFCKEFLKAVEFLQNKYNCDMSYDAQKIYYNCNTELNGGQFYNERIFSNINIEITVMERIPVIAGDKLTNRYGGKGVVSRVVDDELMPRTQDGRVIDIQANILGVYNRENLSQLFEMECNNISHNIASYIEDSINDYIDFDISCMDTDTLMRWDYMSEKERIDDIMNYSEDFPKLSDRISICVSMILQFLKVVSTDMYNYMNRVFDSMTVSETLEMLQSIVKDGCLYLDLDPIKDNMNIDKLETLYDMFPWIKEEYLLIPMRNSVGKIVLTKSRRPLIVGDVYYYRLKQYGEEKFSVTNMSATNLMNQNSRTKSSKLYHARYNRTPIRFGDMELGNLTHIGSNLIVQLLMLYSTSPEGRMLSKELLTGDPYNIDVKLNDTAKNRNVEILNTYLKSIGIKIVFEKKLKKYDKPVTVHPMLIKPSLIRPIYIDPFMIKPLIEDDNIVFTE